MRGAWGVGRGAWLPAALLGLLVACGDSSRGTSGATGARGAATTPDSPRPTPAARPPCPPDGLWHPCSVEHRLEMSGLVPTVAARDATEPPLTVRGIRYDIGRASLLVLLYPDERARKADQARLDSAAYLDPYQPVGMQEQATAIGNFNLLAILRSRNDHLRERIGDALTAGPPQPERGKR